MPRFQVVRLNDCDEVGLYYRGDKADMYFTIYPILRRRSPEFDSLDAPSLPVTIGGSLGPVVQYPVQIVLVYPGGTHEIPL